MRTLLAQVRAQTGWLIGQMLHGQEVTKPGLQTLNATKGQIIDVHQNGHLVGLGLG